MSSPTPLRRLLFESNMDLEDLIEKKKVGISYTTLINIRRGFKLENRRKKIESITKEISQKYSIAREEKKPKRLYFPNRSVMESGEIWKQIIKNEFDIQIKVLEEIPEGNKFLHIFFKIIPKIKRKKYVPDQANLKKLAKIFKVPVDAIYEDRSEEKD